MRTKLTLWVFTLAWVPWSLINAADEKIATNHTHSGTVSNATSGMGKREAGAGGSEALLEKVISRASKGGDGPYDTNLTEKVLARVTALSGQVKQDNRWIIIRVLNMKEEDLILGLSAFLKYSRGKYPSALTGNTMCEELVKLVDRSPVQGRPRGTEEQFKKEFVNAMCGSGFFQKMVREKRDARYYGGKVTVFDAGRVLARWKLEGNVYRVIFSDLRAEDVTAQRLGELEK